MALTKAPIVAHGLASLSIAPKIASATWEQIGYVKEGTVAQAPTANPIRVELSMAWLHENGLNLYRVMPFEPLILRPFYYKLKRGGDLLTAPLGLN